MIRKMSRLLFGPIGRILLVLLIVIAAWASWFVWPSRPLTTITMPVFGNVIRRSSDSRCDHVFYWMDGLHTNQPSRLVVVNLIDGTITDVVMTKPFSNWHVSKDLSWMAWEASEDSVKIA